MRVKKSRIGKCHCSKSKNRNIRQAAERIAKNTPIQGSAADIIKLAMLQVSAALKEYRFKARLLLQVHDELVLEAPENEVEQVIDMLALKMAGVMKLRVPLLVDIGCGKNWLAAH